MLQVQNLTKRYGDLLAVDDLSFDLPDGQIVGFVGANGAGKSTTMRIIMGVLAATAGTVRWRGNPITDADRRSFGYMPEERGLYPKMSVASQLEYFGRLHGLERAAARSNMESLTDQLNLAQRRKDEVQKLSLGNQQRVQLAAALVSDPKLLVLDEPFSGLDPVAVEVMSGVLHERAAKGVATLFSSHQLDLVERLCDRVIIIRDGKMIANDSVAALKNSAVNTWQLVSQGNESDVRALADRLGGTVSNAEGGLQLIWSGADNQAVLQEALSLGQVSTFGAVVPSLTELFREVVSKKEEVR